MILAARCRSPNYLKLLVSTFVNVGDCAGRTYSEAISAIEATDAKNPMKDPI